MGKKRNLTVEERAAVVTLKKEGYVQRAIARKQKISLWAVQEILKKKRETDTMKDRVKTGRPRLTSKRHDQEDLIPGRRTFVRPRIGEEYHPECLVSTVKRGGGKLLVYGGE